MIPSRRKRRQEIAHEQFNDAIQQWRGACVEVAIENDKEAQIRLTALIKHRNRKALHEARQAEQHAAVEAEREAFKSKTPASVDGFFTDLLARSGYPSKFPEEARIQYEQETGTLLVDYELPNPNALPIVKEVKYIATRNFLQEVYLSDTWLRKAYDDVLYQIALRVLHELFLHDEQANLQSIVFNGWVRSIDKATGAEAHACIMSVHVQREEFQTIRLDQVEPKACFRKLKGVASSKLTELTPIRPVVSLKRDDERFVDPYAVLGAVDDRTNLASMDWLDFEKPYSRGV